MRTAIIRGALVLACAAVLVVTAAFAPIALRELNVFRVQRVEVNGVRYLTAASTVEAAGIDASANVFDDPASWLDRLRVHPLIADVSIDRRVPGTLILDIEEAVPVAFARTPELRAIGSHGRVLPLNPADEGLNLPVLTVRTRVSGSGRAVDRPTLDILAFLATMRHVEPDLIDWVSEIGMEAGAVRLVLRTESDAEVLVPVQPGADRLHELASTLAELAAPRVVPAPDGTGARAAQAELADVRRIDVRFHDQVVVSMRKGKS
ncbi:MAG TPA: FtsQ-type POTRA domain-containing protein [Longimicrobiales bacterium]|nr:FtsQ-type POTRA domain-containing protein [Longimicrobiales bacterium]